MTDPTTEWLLRLRVLTLAERPALVDEMSEGEAKMVLLRLIEREAKLEALLEQACEAMLRASEMLGRAESARLPAEVLEGSSK